jgi:phosphoribosylamine--glycine ligase
VGEKNFKIGRGARLTVGILGISYGSRFACIADSLSRSEHDVKLFIADKQANPFNIRKAEETRGKHIVIPDLNVDDITKFAKKYEKEIDFGVLGPEAPGMKGIRDRIEKETKIKMICPTLEYFIERSKVEQRKLIEEIIPSANPRFKVFDPRDYGSESEVKRDVYRWLDEVGDEVAVKPDAPATGKGVGVWGDHFASREGLFKDYFLPNFERGAVIVEEKLEGEEFSLQFVSDGEHLVPTPAVRDYKRAFDWDLGPNTGGMGSYKDRGDLLPFMRKSDWREALKIGEKIHGRLKETGGDQVRGILYMAYMVTKHGVKILEINSRWGDPEVMNILPILKDDFVEVCFKSLDGKLKRLSFEDRATVVTYAVPLDYGGYASYSGPRKVDLSNVEKLKEKHGDNMRIYPGSMEVRNGEYYALGSRTVAVVGIADTLEKAREISMEGIRKIDGPLRHREDIALPEYINRSKRHMEKILA